MVTLVSIVITFILLKHLAKFFIENDSGKPWLGMKDEDSPAPPL